MRLKDMAKRDLETTVRFQTFTVAGGYRVQSRLARRSHSNYGIDGNQEYTTAAIWWSS